MIQDVYGNRMVLPNLLEPVGLVLAINGSYEPETVDLLRRHLTHETAFIDVGANVGSYTVALAGYVSHVVAVEASPAVLPFLQRNVELTGRSNIEVFSCALSAPGMDTVSFYVPPMDHFGMGSSAAQFGVEAVTVAARSLDDILGHCQLGRVGAVKVDVEGYEAHVFLGAKNLLGSPEAPLMVFEFCDWAEERAFPGRKGWAQQILLDVGYSLWPLASYLNKSMPISKPVSEGCHTIVGYKL